MASDYARKRDAAKKERAANLRQQYREVNALYQAKLAQGMTQAQAATAQAGDAQTAQAIGLPGFQNYTVKSGDNVATIAQATGTTPDALLAANPDVKNVQTGMVLQAPVQGPPKPAGYNALYPQGQPANPVTAQFGTLGGQNAQGSEAWRIQQQTQGNLSYTAPQITTQRPMRPGQAQANAQTPTGSFTAQNPGRNVQGGGFGFNPLNPTPGRNVTGGPQGINSLASQNTYAQQAMAQNQGGYVNGQNPYARVSLQQQEQLVAERFMQQIKGQGLIPSNEMTQFLVNKGYIRPKQQANQPGYTSGGRYRIPSRGGGGGGGGNSRPPQGGGGGYQEARVPAFSSGAGFQGLINWRI